MRSAAIAAGLSMLLVLGCAGTDGTRNDANQGEPVTRPPIREVLARHTDELMSLPSVIGTGEGEDGGEPAIVVFVTRRNGVVCV